MDDKVILELKAVKELNNVHEIIGHGLHRLHGFLFLIRKATDIEVILLADELSADLVIMDERKGYEVLSNLFNIKVIGTISLKDVSELC